MTDLARMDARGKRTQSEEYLMKISLKDWVIRHQLVSYFVLAYLIMYGMVFGYLYGLPIPYLIVWIIFASSPTISAIAVSGVIGGMSEVKRLLAGFTRWNVGLRWYLAALFLVLGPLAIALVYQALGNYVPGAQPGLTTPTLIGQMIIVLLSGPLSEEAGWRGFALPRLEENHSALTSSLILGLIWAGWHIPLYFLPGSSQAKLTIPLWAYVALILTVCAFLTWLYNNTRGSLIITVLAHFSFNLSGGLLVGILGMLPQMVFFLTAGPSLAVGVVAIFIIFGPQYVSRKPISELPFRPKEDARNPSVRQTVSD